MSTLQVKPNTFRQYGDIAARMATTIATAGAVDKAASVAAAAPAFGLIGQEFLASFADAQANHFSALNQLAKVFADTSTAACNAARHYTQADQHNATAFITAESVAP